MLEIVVAPVNTALGAFGALLTPLGLQKLTYPDEPLETLHIWARKHYPQANIVAADSRLQALSEQLTAYFQGDLREFDFPLDLAGTPFQKEVWNALQKIGYGETRTYGQLAAALGRPAASRAVGAANGANPIPILVPCHRVIGSNNKLIGYGGGLALKKRLLETEGVFVQLGSV